jgi:[protein-PII] uridylyltransferase
VADLTLENLLHRLESELAESPQVIPVFKSALTDGQALLTQRFQNGESVDNLVAERARFMDGILRLAWHRYNWHQRNKGWRKARISLLAVGGYGRGELLPHSDIDLLILLERNNHRLHRDNIQSFTTLLWDIGLEVGHSVRSIGECRDQAKFDVTVVTAMMEARTILGDEELRRKLADRIAPDKIWSAKDFYIAKRNEQRDRHEKSDHTEYSLEPNVKISPGGLRDIQTLSWVALRQYGTRTFAELTDSGILTELESQEISQAISLLWKIRFALHLISGRDENRLLFEHQQKIAAMFGFEDGDQLAVEQFMQQYYRVAQKVNTINETLLQHFDEAIIQSGKRLQVRPVNDRFRIASDLLEVTSDDVFSRHPSSLLEMFVIAGSDESIDGFRASTIRMAREHVHLIDDNFRADPDNAALFMALLGSNNHLFTQLRRMGRWGILGAYLPEFGRVIGQMQFDLFHIYTVDAHTLQVVRNMRRFRYKNNEQQFPVAAHIHSRLPRIELLYIAGLFHDIAKGMGGDHSELGVDIARQFCERHALATWDTNLVCWLVRNHLVMSTTAQRKDIQDPEVIHEFAVFVGDQVRLNYLYALTVADINATNPTLWNGWRASLMRQLYSDTRKALRQGLEQQVDREAYIHDIQRQALERLVEKSISASAVNHLWNQVDDEYFLRESITDIVAHAEVILNHDDDTEPVVLVHDDKSRRSDAGYTQIFVHLPDRKDLFVSIVNAIDELGLDIVDARIATSASLLTFNTFTVLESDGQPVGDIPARIEKIRKTIIRHLQQDELATRQNRRTSRMLKQFKQKTQVNFSQDERLNQTAVEVISPDRPGLLAIVARTFMDLDINLVSARVTTLGERVEDVFYVTDRNDNPVREPAVIEEVRSRICDALDSHIEKIAAQA